MNDIKRWRIRFMECAQELAAHIMAIIENVFSFGLAEMVKNTINNPVRSFSPGKKTVLRGFLLGLPPGW